MLFHLLLRLLFLFVFLLILRLFVRLYFFDFLPACCVNFLIAFLNVFLNDINFLFNLFLSVSSLFSELDVSELSVVIFDELNKLSELSELSELLELSGLAEFGLLGGAVGVGGSSTSCPPFKSRFFFVLLFLLINFANLIKLSTVLGLLNSGPLFPPGKICKIVGNQFIEFLAGKSKFSKIDLSTAIIGKFEFIFNIFFLNCFHSPAIAIHAGHLSI